MKIWRFREWINELPDHADIVMWIQRREGPGLMAQVSSSMRINNDAEGRPYLMLMACEDDIIRDGKLKNETPALPPSQEPSPPVRPAQIESPTVDKDRESKALAVIDSKGKPGGIMKR
jgi:hypothetical protein